MKKTRLAALGLGALSLAGLVGAGVGLSVNNNVRADEVKAYKEGDDLYYRSGDNGWVANDSTKMTKLSNTEYEMENVSMSQYNKFKIARPEYSEGEWGGNNLNKSGITKALFQEYGGNAQCNYPGKYDINFNSSTNEITLSLSDDNQKTFLLTDSSDMTKVYLYNSEDDKFTEWGVSPVLDYVKGNAYADLSISYSEKTYHVYDIATVLLRRYQYCILRDTGSGETPAFDRKSETDAIDLGVVCSLGQGTNGLIGGIDSDYYKALSFAKLTLSYMDSDDGLSKSICAAEDNGGAEAIVDAYKGLSDGAKTIISDNKITINTYTRASEEDPFVEGNKGDVSLQKIYETALALDTKNKSKPSGVNVVSNNSIDTHALVIASASVVAGVGVASGLIIIRKKKLN